MVTNSPRVAALDRLLELVVVVGADMARGLGEVGLTVPRAHLLFELQRSGPSTQRALADALEVTARNVTGLVDGLAGAGLVVRTSHPTDRRATLVRLTPAGAELGAQLVGGRAQFAESLFGGLPERQLECFVTVADAVLAQLREPGRAAPAGDDAGAPGGTR